jgi:lysophospholipase L1-like esterase
MMGRGGIVEYSATAPWGAGIARWLDGIEYDVLIQARPTAGAFYYLHYGYTPELVGVIETGTKASLRATIRAGNYANQGYECDLAQLVTGVPSPRPLASDSFTRADGSLGTTDAAGHQEGVGGGGKAWSEVGAWGVVSNVAACATLDDGLGVAFVDAGDDDVWVQAKLHRSAGAVGVVARYQDVDNYLVCYHDGTNIKIDEVVGGVLTNLVTDANAFVDGALLQFKVDGCYINAFYNGAVIHGNVYFCGVLAGVGGVGLYTTDAGNSLEDFCVWATRPNWTFPGMLVKRRVVCIGDSITEGIRAYWNKLWKSLGSAYAVRPVAKGGQTSTQILARFDSQVLRRHPEMVCILCGVNDLWGAAAGEPIQTTVKTNLQTMYSAAKTAGMTVVALTITPCEGHVSHTAAVQTNIDAINAWILADALDVDYRVDTYTAVEDPANPDALLPAYDDGGHLHLTDAGGDAMGDAVYAVLSA